MKKLSLGEYSASFVGNWSGKVDNHDNLCCCHWMDLHKDDDYGLEKNGDKTWSIIPRAINTEQDPVLIHKVRAHSH